MAGGKTYNAVEVDPTDPTVEGMVYQVTQVDPTDPHTQGKVYQVNMQGGGGGGVTSINGKTGVVVLGAKDVNAAPQYSSMPVASTDNLGNIVQFVGTTDANYTNGYFYKCISDGQNPATYSWQQVNVQPSSGGGLPSQTGNAGKFLTTDGTDASWGEIPVVEDSANGNLTIATSNIVPSGTSNNIAIGSSSEILGSGNGNVAIGKSSQAGTGSNNVAIGMYAHAANGSVHIGGQSALGAKSISILGTTSSEATQAIQLGGGTSGGAINSDANTFKVANANGNFEIMSADGTIPAARHADTTSAAQGQVLTLDSNLKPQWAAGGGGGLPSQTGHSGDVLTTDGTDASWTTPTTITFRTWGANE